MKINGNSVKPGMIVEHKTDLWVVTKSQNELLFDQAEFDFIQARESDCDDEPLPDLPANP